MNAKKSIPINNHSSILIKVRSTSTTMVGQYL